MAPRAAMRSAMGRCLRSSRLVGSSSFRGGSVPSGLPRRGCCVQEALHGSMLSPRGHQHAGCGTPARGFRRSDPTVARELLAPRMAMAGQRRQASFFAHEWHHQGFMEESSLDEKKRWLADLSKNYPSEVDAEAYAVVLRAVATSNEPGSPQRAEELLGRMTVEPNDACYQAVLQAWSQTKREDAHLCVVRAERWFARIAEPTMESYHTLLNVVSRGRVKVNNRVRRKNLLIEHATKAEAILEAMALEPDTTAYNYVIRAWCRVRSDPELMVTKVMEWLQRMEECQQNNPAGPVQPNTKSYCMGMEVYGVLAGHRAKVGPGDGSDEVAQVERLLNYMQGLHKDGYADVAPNTVAYNILISAYARLAETHSAAPLKAEEVLRCMTAIGQDAEPDVLSFTKVIQAWSNAKRQTSGQRAAYWLDKLWDRYEEKGKDKNLSPKTATYVEVMKASKDDPKCVEKVFLELLRAEKSEMVTHIRPNTESFILLINTWAKNDLPRAVMWLEELIRREEGGASDPNYGISVTTTPEIFHVILKNAAANPSMENFVLGMKVFEHYRSSRHPMDIKPYTWLLELGLQALSESQQNEKRKIFIDNIIQDCQNDGLVSNLFLRELASGPVYYDGWTVEESLMTIQTYFSEWPLPPSWTRNIQEEFYQPKKSDIIRTRLEVLLRIDAGRAVNQMEKDQMPGQ